MSAAEAVLAVEIYAGLGAVAAVAFLLFGLDRIDANARGALAFRPLIVPGLILLWPLVLWRWRKIATGRGDVQEAYRPPLTAQRILGTAFALAVPFLLAAALLARQTGPLERAPVLLTPPEATE